jgi:hypothetical protein
VTVVFLVVVLVLPAPALSAVAASQAWLVGPVSVTAPDPWLALAPFVVAVDSQA